LVPPTNHWIITGAHLADDIVGMLPELPRDHVISEPVGRNTAPCIGLAAVLLQEEVGDTTLGVFPADHFISQEQAFLSCVRNAYEDASQTSIVTLGIQPTRPETGYGYIRAAAADDSERGARDVDALVEKPDRETALRYLAEGNYLWNA